MIRHGADHVFAGLDVGRSAEIADEDVDEILLRMEQRVSLLNAERGDDCC